MMIFLYNTIEAYLGRLPMAMAGKTDLVSNFSKGSRTSSGFTSITLRPTLIGTEMGIDRNVDSSQFGNLPVTSSMSHRDVQFEGNPVYVKVSRSARSHSKPEMDAENEGFSDGSPYYKQFHGRKKRIDLGSERQIGNVYASQLGNSSVSSSTSFRDEGNPKSPYFKQFRGRKKRIDLGSERQIGNVYASPLGNASVSSSTSFRDKGKPKSTRVETSPHGKSHSKHGMSYKKLDRFEGSSPLTHWMSYKKLDSSESSSSFNVSPFDICVPRSSSWHDIEDEESHNKEEQVEDRSRQEVLRPGMVLLKQYLSLTEQIEIVKTCQELGKGPGGFYQPRYKDGAKLRLQMMCLGLDWDPQTRKYEKQRRVDGCEPPDIPQALNQFVLRAISDAHALIKKEFRLINVEHILPAMSPNICIVNFYTTSGRLGLHQDRDESHESLQKGLPVVSFSIGDSAEFLYGDDRDIDKSETVALESGDVLIFGGESRQIFHGVSSIIPNSAPGTLLEQSNLRPGRLNLTFGQY